MDQLVRYLDGELDESEVESFMEAIATDPKLETELRLYEQLLALSQTLTPADVPEDFTEGVMNAIASEDEARRPARRAKVVSPVASPRRTRQWVTALAVAASLVLAFFGGRLFSMGDTGIRIDGEQNGPLAGAPQIEGSGAVPAAFGAQHTVRLVYFASSPDVREVSVAGTFNEWDPTVAPLRLHEGVWTTTLVLPSGSYEYMFVEDGARWTSDPLATLKRDDGFGSQNAILDLGV